MIFFHGLVAGNVRYGHFQDMRTRRTMFVKGIDISQPLVVGKAKPLAIQLGAEISQGV